MRIWGVHIGEGCAVFARRGVIAHTVDRVEVLSLDDHHPREVALKQLISELRKMQLFEMEDHVHLTFYSPEVYTFVTDMDRSLPNVEETLAWELDARVEGGARNYAFSTSKINNHRYLCSGMPQKSLTKIVQMFTRLGVEVSSVDVPVIAALQSLDINGFMGKTYAYLDGGLKQSSAAVVVNGTLKSLHTLAYDEPMLAARELLMTIKEEHPEIAEYVVAGEAFASLERVKRIVSDYPGGRVSNPFQTITYTGESPMENTPTLLLSAIGLSQKAV